MSMTPTPRASSESNPQHADARLPGEAFLRGRSEPHSARADAMADPDEQSRPRAADSPTLLERERRSMVVRSALEGLPWLERSVVVAVYVRGRSRAQVAAEYGVSLGTVHRHLFLGLRQLGTAIDESLIARSPRETGWTVRHEGLG
jgi:RNA polymerase sigma factor (sigma-70 family)